MVANDVTSISNVVKIYHLFQNINSWGGGHRYAQKSRCCHQHTFPKIRQPSKIDYYVFHGEEHELRTKARIFIICACFKLVKSRCHKMYIGHIFSCTK